MSTRGIVESARQFQAKTKPEFQFLIRLPFSFGADLTPDSKAPPAIMKFSTELTCFFPMFLRPTFLWQNVKTATVEAIHAKTAERVTRPVKSSGGVSPVHVAHTLQADFVKLVRCPDPDALILVTFFIIVLF